MGFFKGLKKKLKGVIKIAVKTAPLWSSFIPGGSVVGNIISRVGQAREKAIGVKRALGLGNVGTPRGRPSGASHVSLQEWKSRREEAAFEGQGVGHAGIRGPVPQRMFGHRITPSSLQRMTRQRATVRRPARRGGGRRLKFGSAAWRRKYAPRARARRRRAA